MIELLTPARLGWAVGIVLLTLIVRFFQKLHFHRTVVKGLPGPPHSYIWGSLKSMNEVVSKQPKRAAPQTFPSFLKEKYDLGDYFYVDPWPFGDPIMMIFDVDIMNEFTVKHNLPKHPAVADFMQHLGGPGNLVSSEGAEWKKWRSAFNPGFSATHLMSLVPAIVDDVLVFKDILTTHAENDHLFRMERAATRLTVDIIGRVVLDFALDSQKGPNELVDTFMRQVQWQKLGAQFNPIELIDFPIRVPMQHYLTWKMDRYIGKRLDERFATRAGRGKTNAVVDLALEAYLKEVKGTTGDLSEVKAMDPEFKQAAISNMKTFIFAGHDTTSSTISYAYYYLAKNPEMLAKARKELDGVFGLDPDLVADQLKQDGRLLNKLEYTLAVTREVLRLQPPGSTVRVGQKGFFLHDPKTGEPLPTEHFMLWPVNVGLHRNEKYWPDPHAFRPDRHLHSSSTDTNNFSGAWIGFSKGSRNCIGQELAIIETKIILAMTLRTFDFQPAFNELEKLKGDGSGYPSDVEGVQEQFGEQAYQVQLGTGKPREGMPCRVRLRG
ncbi:hypothetical protein LTR36_003061 [Oleoguttula mirabilis]|uniref:Cytochrome P450 n=1 Tax=Oleoguttula mirabilis TaxID=1507867 RepID=A0AAV9JWS3_9PEZI|nr:hypothetical protein LTR36_003061 [Oleoguttula mirabilis]